MRYWVDSEFIDDGRTIDLISIGLVCEDGREYYAQSVEFEYEASNANKWIRENVFPHLDLGCTCFTVDSRNAVEDMRDMHLFLDGNVRERHKKLYPVCPWRRLREIAQEIKAFCDPEQYGKPEFIGWCAGYDFVLLCQLFGTMMDLPADWPHYIKDLQHVLDDRSWTDDMLPEQEGSAHNALGDAKHIRRLWTFLEEWHQRGVKV